MVDMTDGYVTRLVASHGETNAQENSVFTASSPFTRAVPLKKHTEETISVRETLSCTVSPGRTCRLNLAPIILVRTGIFSSSNEFSPRIEEMSNAPV